MKATPTEALAGAVMAKCVAAAAVTEMPAWLPVMPPLGGVRAVIRYYRIAIELDPKLPQARYNLGYALYAKRDLEGAMRNFRIYPACSAPAPFRRAPQAFQRRSRRDGAIRCYRTAIALNPKFVQAHGNLGNLLAAKGDLDGAIRCSAKLPPVYPRVTGTAVSR